MKEIRFKGFNSKELKTIGELLSKIGDHSTDISTDDLKIIIDEITGDVGIITKSGERITVGEENVLERRYPTNEERI